MGGSLDIFKGHLDLFEGRLGILSGALGYFLWVVDLYGHAASGRNDDRYRSDVGFKRRDGGRYITRCVIALSSNYGAVNTGLSLASDKGRDRRSRDGAHARGNEDLGNNGLQDGSARGDLRRGMAYRAVRSLYAQGDYRCRRIARYAVIFLRYTSDDIAYGDRSMDASST